MQRAMLALVVLAGFGTVVLSGCGGGDSAAAGGSTGGIQVSVLFPPRPEAVAPQALPAATNSVRIQVLKPSDESPIVPDHIVSRSGAGPHTVTIDHVPVGPCLVRVLAYESYDGTGRAIARAEVLTAITAGQVTKVSLVTEALVVRVDVSPSAVIVERTTKTKLTGTCYDADDNVVVASIDWKSDSANASVAPDGTVTGDKEGTANITATHPASGLSDDCVVTVYRRHTARVEIKPSEASLRPPTLNSVQLSATAFDAANVPILYATINWSSDNPAVQVDSTGLVTTNATAPTTATITASAGEGTDGKCNITVVPEGELQVEVR